MKRNDYYGDRKIASMFEVPMNEVLAAKCGEQEFDLQDIRFCLGCKRFFDASIFVATVEFLSEAEFVCSNCSDRFERSSDRYKQWFLCHCESNYKELKLEHKLRPKATGKQDRRSVRSRNTRSGHPRCHCMANAAGEIEEPSGSCAVHGVLVVGRTGG